MQEDVKLHEDMAILKRKVNAWTGVIWCTGLCDCGDVLREGHILGWVSRAWRGLGLQQAAAVERFGAQDCVHVVMC